MPLRRVALLLKRLAGISVFDCEPDDPRNPEFPLWTLALTGDPELERLAAQVRASLLVDPQELRKSESIRSETARNAAAIAQRMQAYLEFPLCTPTRRESYIHPPPHAINSRVFSVGSFPRERKAAMPLLRITSPNLPPC